MVIRRSGHSMRLWLVAAAFCSMAYAIAQGTSKTMVVTVRNQTGRTMSIENLVLSVTGRWTGRPMRGVAIGADSSLPFTAESPATGSAVYSIAGAGRLTVR